MKKISIISVFLLIPFLHISSFAQTNGLPKFKKSELYKSVRAKMLKAGWKPAPSSNAFSCGEGDERCEDRPEMELCMTIRLSTCTFRWKRKGKIVMIYSVGETKNNIYDGYKFEK
ncbi:MAG: hypothetical protein AAB336_13430 [Acidobacteriota bacterium]